MTIILKRFLGTDSFPVSVSATPVTPASLPVSGSFLMPPGNYHLGSIGPHACFEEGYYRWWIGSVSAVRIIYAGNIHKLMSSLAWSRVDGRGDESLNNSDMTYKATASKLSILCGRTATWVKSILDSQGIQNRIVNCLTAGTPTGHYDGHVMNEVKIDGQWVLFDLPDKCTFNNMSLRDALPVLPTTPRTKIAAGSYYAAEPSVGFEVLAWHENTKLTVADQDAEIERVLQIPGVLHTDNHYYFYIPDGITDTPALRAWIVALPGVNANYHVLEKAAWNLMFYP